MRLTILLASLALMFALAVAALQTPAARSPDAPPQHFSAHRAMVDIREISQAPHPLGSAEHARVRQYLVNRLTTLGFTVTEQEGDLTIKAVQRLKNQGGTPEAAGFQATNIIAVRGGRHSDLPPLMLMAHYDTTAKSPGAGDDSSGVAVILETARALKERGATDRTLIVLLTDGEEIGLEGARVFFNEHPLASAPGFIINLEARGGGGRVHMFETGMGDGPTVRAFAPLAMKADGGVGASSLSSYLYDRMPNATDFTLARDRGMAGINLAFIGRAHHYHSALSTPDNLDIGSVQNIGSQTLEMATRLDAAKTLPGSGDNLVYADIFGRFVISHPPVVGWVLLGLSLIGLAYSIWQARRVTRLGPKQLVQGILDGVWFIAAALVLSQMVGLLAGPVSQQEGSVALYYTMLRRLPWMEAATALTVLGLAFVLMSGARAHYRRIVGYGLAVATLILAVIGKAEPVFIGAGAVAAVLSLWPGAASRTLWGGWTGAATLAFIGGCALQAVAPQAALIVTWPLLLAVIAMAVTATVSPALSELRSLIAPAIATILGGAWLIGLGHFAFLALGITMPGVLGIIGFFILLFVRPLVPAREDNWLTVMAVVFMLVAAGLSGASRLIEPAPANPVPDTTHT